VSRSLSVLLPVKDAQATLHDDVHVILDMAADAGGRFELLIIDDASTDATSELADELTRHYPQVRFIRHGTAQGREAAIRTGLEQSEGDIVMLRDNQRGFFVLDRQQSRGSRPARPNYLARLKQFAFGE
jgi:glycosyltransferase involved in cell wall biosynthesis